MAGYPVELNLNGRPVLVVGLGTVGRRKVSGLAASGARVIGVDPFASPLNDIEHLAEPYQTTHLRGMSLVFAAATPEVNRQVIADARSVGIWVNAVDDPASGDFTVPAVGRIGGVTLTVSTSGASPALAVALRDHALKTLPPGAAELAALCAELRPLVLARLASSGAEPSVRRQLLSSWGDSRWLDLYLTDGPSALRAALWNAVNEATSANSPAPNEPTVPLASRTIDSD